MFNKIYKKLFKNIKKDEKMEFDNKTILVSGLLIGAIIAMYLQYEQIANVIFGGLIGYLSKDHLDAYLSNKNNDEIIQDDADDI